MFELGAFPDLDKPQLEEGENLENMTRSRFATLDTGVPHSHTSRGPDARHAFWKYAKELRTHDIRVDDDLKRRQQQQRHDLDNDLRQMKGKGYSPHSRGKQLPCAPTTKRHV